MQTNLPDWAKEIAERESKATKGHWEAKFSEEMNSYENEDWVLYSGNGNLCASNYYSTPGIEKEEDAKFIAHARADIPALLQALSEARGALEFYVKAKNAGDIIAQDGEFMELSEDGCAWLLVGSRATKALNFKPEEVKS